MFKSIKTLHKRPIARKVIVILSVVVSQIAIAQDAGNPVLLLDLNPPPAEFQNTQAHGIVVGSTHACALTPGGGVRCWGSNSRGQLGYPGVANVGINNAPTLKGNVHLGTGRTALQVVAGAYHTCALLDTKDVRCWGANDIGALGLGHKKDIGDDEHPDSQPLVNLAGAKVTKLAAGAGFTCALMVNQTVRCWGYRNILGLQNPIFDDGLGDEPGELPIQSPIQGITAKDITAGMFHACVITMNGFATCWGKGEHGELGRASTADIGADANSPVPNTPILLDANQWNNINVKQIVAKWNSTCVLLGGGQVKCWGSGWHGQTGQANTNNIGDNEYPASVPTVPLTLPGETVISLQADSPSARSTCAIIDGTNDVGTKYRALRCWGDNSWGQLGYGHINSIGDNEPAVAAGNVDHGVPSDPARASSGMTLMCTNFTNGKIKCAGYDGDGAMGDGAGAKNIGDDEPMKDGLTVK